MATTVVRTVVRQDLVAVEDLHPVAVLTAWCLVQLQADVCAVGRPVVVEAAQHRQQQDDSGVMNAVQLYLGSTVRERLSVSNILIYSSTLRRK